MAAAGDRHGQGKTLFIRNLPYSTTNEALEKVFSDIGPVKSCFVVKDKESGKCRGFGYVKFTILEDAEKALSVKYVEGRSVHVMYANKKEKRKRFGQPLRPDSEGKSDDVAAKKIKEDNKESDNKESENKKKKKKKKTKTVEEIPVKGQKQAPNPLNEGKRARVIVRNLAFKCTKEELEKEFGKCGTVVDVHIPKKASGTRLGFGFVQFSNKAQAGMAVREINGKTISGRVVAVDWALPKDKFESKQEATPMNEDAEESMEVEEEDDQQPSQESSSSSDDESDDEDKDDESSSDEDEKMQDEEDDSGIDEEISPKTPNKNMDRESDVGEGRTVFIRNLPYTVENEELEEFFSQFGDVKYARVVIDKNTGMPRGSAFVQFKTKESADSCVEASSRGDDSNLTVGGRLLIVSLAVSRQQAGDFAQKKDKKKEEKDSRNLYLAREGMIRQGTEAAKEVPAADLARRMKIDAAKRRKLKDQNIFVSSTRLCVHNIPPTVTDKQLRTVVSKAAGDKKAKIVECRIMRDLNRLNSQGQGKSRGYAFCAFAEHEHAIKALRHLNNNPDIFGDKKRLIVEFSLENKNALEAKQKRLEKSKAQLKLNAQETGKKRKRNFKEKKGKNLLERKKEQDKVARSLHKGPLGLPSHSGPKQRHRPRSGKEEGKKKIGHKASSVKEKPVKLKNPSKKRKDFDSFDKLVASYKQKIMSSAKF